MDFAEQLKSSIDIVRVIQEYVKLRKSGPRYSGLCPFHNEKTPSFSVHPAHQFFKCFGCGAGGDVFEFVMKIQNLSFYEALKLLADQHGIPMPKRSEYADQDTRLRAALYQMHELAQEDFHSRLRAPGGAPARAYLLKRGIAPAMVDQFGIGYADSSGRAMVRLLEQHDFTLEQMEASGLVGRRDDGSLYDRFRHRLIFPIHNESGKVIAFGGRSLDAEQQPKYLNSPETPLYKKSSVLFNLHRAKDAIRKADRAVLVEGYMDAIGVFASGVQEVVACCGTALTGQQAQSIKRQSANILVNFDADSAGEKAVEDRVKLLLAESMRVRVVHLEGGLDPDEFCKQHGADAYRKRVDEAKSFFHWMAERARGKYDMRTAEGRVDAFQFLLPAIQGLPEKIERVAVANDVASYLGISAGLVLENFRKLAADRREKTMQTPAREPLRSDDRILLNLLVSNREARVTIVPHLKQVELVEHSPARRIYESIILLHESGIVFDFNQLHARLEDPERERLCTALLGEALESSLEDGLACIESLRHSQRNGLRSELKARVRDAERAGNVVEAMRLMRELESIREGAKA
ncbi:MAG: DNA primase [Acidobacteriota bacterium]|nr:DNA primase [Acidobacteriota bacterium]